MRTSITRRHFGASLLARDEFPAGDRARRDQFGPQVFLPHLDDPLPSRLSLRRDRQLTIPEPTSSPLDVRP